jgi:hypothetical protein
MVTKKLSLLALLLLIISPVWAQDLATEADKKFKAGNYDGALIDYLKLHEKDGKSELYNFRLGICYLETSIDKCKALPFLEYITTLPKFDPMGYYYQAQAYAQCLRFENAIDAYLKFLKQPQLPAGITKEHIDRLMEMCQNGRDLMGKRVNVAFENLGPNINSPFADYSPFISAEETFLMYNSRRPDDAKLLPNGKYSANVYISSVKDGKWQKSEDIGTNVNTVDGDEEIIGVCADGNTLIFNFNNALGKDDIFVGPKLGNEILPPAKLNVNVNSTSAENGASISPDGRTLYFASNRPGGLGGFDIYRCKILPDGQWGEAYNLGPNINTPYDEDFPNISLDGQVLYFSSKGHNSMGGYDIFRADLLEDGIEFGPPVNMGYPVNTPMDDMNLCMSGKGRYGYMSTLRKDGLGDLDIYRITFNDVDPELTVVKGIVKSANPAKTVGAASVEVIDSKTNETFGYYKVNPNNGKYAIVLPPGKYYLQIDKEGFKSFSENITILDKGSYVPMIEKDITLYPR